MKKVIFSFLAVAALASCVKEQTLNTQPPGAIAFDNAILDNVTRAAVDPSTTVETISGFNVWGFMDDNLGTVFAGDEVKKANSSWAYANIQYWAPNHTYYFAAISPIGGEWSLEPTGANKLGAGVLTFTNVDGSEDLLYAAKSVQTPATLAELTNNGMDKVKFNFAHLLSKVKFTFKNGYATDNAYVVVRNITMSAPAKATIDLDQENIAWELTADQTATYSFGNVEKLSAGANAECAAERLSIPAGSDYTYTINFTVDVYMGENLALTVDKTSTVTGTALEIGKAYNFTAEINPENLALPAIEFDVIGVDEWIEAGDVAHPVVATINGEPYTTLQAAIDAAAGNTTIQIVSNVQENVTIYQTAGIDLVIDGQGKTYNGTIRISGRSAGTSPETLTIKNLNFVNNSTEPSIDQYWGTSNQTRYGHNITVENCTFTMVGAAELTAVAIDLYQPYNIVVKDVEVTGAASLLQCKGGHQGITVSGAKITGCKNGIGFGTHDGTVSASDIEIDVIGYGIRVDGTNGDLQVKDVNIKALRPIIVRKIGNKTLNKVTLSGNNTLTAGDFYQIIFTTGDDDVAYVAPNAANYSLDAPSDLKVYPTHVTEWVNNAADFRALLEAKVTDITLGAGTFEGKFTIKADGTTITGNAGTVVDCINLNGKDNITLKNIGFNAEGAQWAYDGSGNKRYYASIMSGDESKNLKGSRNLNIDGCTFTGQYTNGGAVIAFADHKRTTGQSGNITIQNCTFDVAGAYYDIYGYYSGLGEFVIEKNTFKTAPVGCNIYLGRYQSSTPVQVKGNTFEKYATLEDAAYIQAHSASYNVSFAASDNIFAN